MYEPRKTDKCSANQTWAMIEIGLLEFGQAISQSNYSDSHLKIPSPSGEG